MESELAELVARDLAEGVRQQVVRAVVTRGARVLLLRRPPGGARGGVWELPGGKVEAGDADLLQALRREVHEETGLEITEVLTYLGAHDYTTRDGLRARQHTWSVAVAGAEIHLSEHDAYAWVTSGTDKLEPHDRRLITSRGSSR
ncbi:NUDIX domain-containing protein [Saccharopolyspora griseoalba]|uniref:NUDIX domain-containing protein n=1 Tax=Saccharopolyspora griseoalba TaxID=1431848 RepID=A0ABW2LDI4_9PSEU